MTELLSKLKNLEDSTLIGWCIKLALHNEQHEELIYTLRDMATDHPAGLAKVIGVEAFALLINVCHEFPTVHQPEMRHGNE